jgi:hypothetical protein
VQKQTVSWIPDVAQKNSNKPDIAVYTASPQKRGTNFGGMLYDRELVTEAVAIFKSNECCTIHSIAISLGIPHLSIHHFCYQNKIFCWFTNSNKPMLTERKW